MAVLASAIKELVDSNRENSKQNTEAMYQLTTTVNNLQAIIIRGQNRSPDLLPQYRGGDIVQEAGI